MPNWKNEEDRLWVAVHEMGHIVAFKEWPQMMDYFMGELQSTCSNQPVDRVGFYCNENQQPGVDYRPGRFAGTTADPNKYMPSNYATKGSYEDFAETWREVVTRAYIRSGDTTYTSRGHKLRFFKELKTQGKQRIKVRFMSCRGFLQTL